MKRIIILLALGITSSAWLQTTTAQVLINDNFSSYANDAALTAVWPRVSGDVTSIYLQADPDPSGTRGQGIQQVNVGANVGRLRQTFAATTPTDSAPLVFRFDFYDANGGSTSGRDYVELRNSASATGLFAGGLNNSVNTGTYAQGQYQARDLDSGGWVQLDTVRSVGWHTFEFTIKSTTVDLRIDGVLDPQFTGRAWSGGVAYDWYHIGSALTSNTSADYDNAYLAVVAVPEPSSVALLALGALGCAWLVRRRAK